MRTFVCDSVEQPFLCEFDNINTISLSYLDHTTEKIIRLTDEEADNFEKLMDNLHNSEDKLIQLIKDLI